ncbi:hypothetical protein [Treponema sp.]|uniref:hypothetical protein n=1 Tax=Treponema sp. TaxID=166 RepID=UPI00298D62D9|nr:hypothetical protein [Treponema sp.]MCR5613312.1 hypothetical protein [Treponema sp.]
MANGIEDLKEKNKDKAKPVNPQKYLSWANRQGREDAEMLMEKSESWSAAKSAKGDYDQDED